jgi:hypothetical protein
VVERRVTDGKRIAQLLASELSGREDGLLSRVTLTEADADAEPSPEGTLAFRVAVDGDPVGTVRMYPERVVLALDGERSETLESGAAVKRGLDAVRDWLSAGR